MPNLVTIYCKNTKQFVQIPCGTSLLELYQQLNLQLPYPVIAARVNYKVQSLNFLIYKPKDIEFIDATSESGHRCYVRTLSMVMACAVHELWPDCDLRIEHPISKGFYCTIRQSRTDTKVITPEVVQQLKSRMQTIIEENRPVITEERQTKEVIRLFSDRNDGETTLFETLGNPYCRYYRIGEYIDYYTGALMPSTGYINLFDVELYYDNILLRIPSRKDPNSLEKRCVQDKRFGIFKEYIGWNKLLHISNVGEFNKACKNQKSFEMIKLSEALHEKKVAQIADQIAHREGGIPKFVLISGPSSSGKTTSANRLATQLRVHGKKPILMSLDDYYLDRDKIPTEADGSVDLEHINTIDTELFAEQLGQLLAGEEVEIPTFNFKKGQREWVGHHMRLCEDTVIIVEGLHALNPVLLPEKLDKNKVFKMYVSPLLPLNLDDHNRIASRYLRLLRRIVRDFETRGATVQKTLSMWDSVRRGEERWIFPFQENADVIFNSSTLYELAVLKRHIFPLLRVIGPEDDCYDQVRAIVKILNYIYEADVDDEIPPTSIVREFIGGNSFYRA